jgi:predicted nucleic acid-binding protein
MNIYNRIFDDQNQIKIRFENVAIGIIFELIEKGTHNPVWSFILQDENSGNPYSNRREYIEMLSSACMEVVEPSIRIREIANNIMGASSARAKDSLHLACAVDAGCNCFITCDERLIRTLNANKDNLSGIVGNIRILNPIDFLREEMRIDVVE